MTRALSLLMSLAVAVTTGGEGTTYYRPYAKPAIDLVYNLLFCDDPQLFVAGGVKPTGPLAAVLAKTAAVDELQGIANDDGVEARLRVLAYNQLRARKVKVRRGQLLGVIVEMPLEKGLDTLAAFADGRMRYINHTGKLAVVETPTKAMAAKWEGLMKASSAAIEHFGPWDKPRLPPPKTGSVRLTFLVSDGLYFGEGPGQAIVRDAIGGPVLAAAAELLVTIVDASTVP